MASACCPSQGELHGAVRLILTGVHIWTWVLFCFLGKELMNCPYKNVGDICICTRSTGVLHFRILNLAGVSGLSWEFSTNFLAKQSLRTWPRWSRAFPLAQDGLDNAVGADYCQHCDVFVNVSPSGTVCWRLLPSVWKAIPWLCRSLWKGGVALTRGQ